MVKRGTTDKQNSSSIFKTNNNFCCSDDDNPVVPGNEVTHLATLPEDEAVVAMMGLPRAGEITRAQLRIKESKEFKVKGVYTSQFLPCG